MRSHQIFQVLCLLLTIACIKPFISSFNDAVESVSHLSAYHNNTTIAALNVSPIYIVTSPQVVALRQKVQPQCIIDSIEYLVEERANCGIWIIYPWRPDQPRNGLPNTNHTVWEEVGAWQEFDPQRSVGSIIGPILLETQRTCKENPAQALETLPGLTRKVYHQSQHMKAEKEERQRRRVARNVQQPRNLAVTSSTA